MAGSAGAIRAGRAYYELFSDMNPLKKGLKTAEAAVIASTRVAASKIAGIAKMVTHPVTALAAAAAPAAILRNFAKTGAELVDMSRRTGASAEALARLGYVANQTGSSIGAVEGALAGIRDKLIAAMRGSEEAQIAFGRLGLNFLQIGQTHPDNWLRLIAERLNAIANPALRAAAATELLGSTDLLPMLQNLKELDERARRLGLSMSNEDAAAAKRFSQAMQDLYANFLATVNVIGAKLAPILTELANKWVEASGGIREWIRAHLEMMSSTEAAWAFVRLQWAKGSQFLREQWGVAMADMETAWINASTAIQKGWIVFGHIFEKVVAGMQSVLQTTMKAIDVMVKSVQKLAGALGLGDLAKKLGAVTLKGFQGVGRAAAGMMGLNDPELKKKLDEIEKERQTRLAALPQGAAGNAAEIARLQADYDAAVAKAKKESAENGKKVAGGLPPTGLGIGGALVHTRGIAALDIRSKEGFSSLTNSLAQAQNPMTRLLALQQQGFNLQQRSWVDLHQIRLKTDKIGVVGL